MKLLTTCGLLAGCLWMTAGQAAGPADFISQYTAEARQAQPGWQPSAERGRALYYKEVMRDGDKVSCVTCHTSDPARSGQTRSYRAIKPLAPAANAERFSDPAKVEKWFKRNCTEVLGRECTAQEKGDWLTYMTAQ